MPMPLRLVFCVLLGQPTLLAAQSDSTATPPADSAAADSAFVSSTTGVYSESQATKGTETHDKNCTGCHAPTSYSGIGFKRLWIGRTVFEFFDQIRRTMPNDNPGKLSKGQYAEITAYVLRLNGQPAGDKDLPEDEEALKHIKIEKPSEP